MAADPPDDDRARRGRADELVAPRTLHLLRRVTERPVDEIERGVGAAIGALAAAAGAHLACIHVLGRDGRALVRTHAWRHPEGPDAPASSLDVARLGPWWDRLAADEAIVEPDLSARTHDPDGAPRAHVADRLAAGSAALLYVPMRHEERTTGFVAFEAATPGPWPADAVVALGTAAQVVLGVLDRADAARERDDALRDLRHLAAEVPGGLFRFERSADGTRRFAYASPRFGELLGIDPEPLRHDASPALDRIHGEDRAAFESSLVASARSLARWDHEFRAIDHVGDVRVLHGRAIPAWRDDGTMVWHGFLHDVTERRRLDDALRRSESELRTMLDLSDDAVVMVDADRRVVAFNPVAAGRARTLFGRELRAGLVIDEVIDDPTFRRDLAVALSGSEVRVVRGPESRAASFPPYWVEVTIRPLRADGVVRGAVYRSVDVSGRVRQRAALEREVAFRRSLLALTHEVLGSAPDVDTHEQVLRHAIAHVPGADTGCVLARGDDGRFRFVALHGRPIGDLVQVALGPESFARRRLDRVERVDLHAERTLMEPELAARFQSHPNAAPLAATLSVPIVAGGELLGFLQLDAFEEDAFDDESLERAELLGGTVAVLLQRRALERALHEERGKLEHLAHHDPLTGLPNRTLLADRLERALVRDRRTDARTALLVVDLDAFKSVNDAFGHAAGDDLLVAVAERLREALRDEDTVARLGGDEFAVVASGLRGTHAAATVAHKVLDALHQEVLVAGRAVRVGGSVGVSVAPDDAADAATLMRHADLAMYRVKREGRGSVAYFTRDLDARMRARAALTEDLRGALRVGAGLWVAYQPRVRLIDGALEGVEALARWDHPSQGAIAPGTFVPLAEEAGLIAALGAFVLDRACADLVAWRTAGLEVPRVCVNVSVHQLRAGDFDRSVREALTRHGLVPQDLELEVTESVVADDRHHATAALAALQATGIRVAMDDFGTGYSSLHRLAVLPVDVLKIDRSFVRGLGDAGPGAAEPSAASRGTAVVDAVLALAAGLGLEVVAEGIEEPAQRRALLARGCRVGQGFLMARPMPAADLPGWSFLPDAAA
jgi:diguanylate cyclase (GGDEF)-like protein